MLLWVRGYAFVGAWYGQDAHTSYFLPFYSFTFLGCIGGAKLLEITHIHIILYNCFAML